MDSGSEGSKRTCTFPRIVAGQLGHDSSNNTPELPKPVPGARNGAHPWLRRAPNLEALDRALFTGPYVLIAPDNSSPGRVKNLVAAREALAAGKCSAAAGQVARGIQVADIDAEQAVVGDACAEALVAWCVKHEIPYIVRESGRAGGRHVLAVGAAEQLAAQWERLCRRLAKRYRTVVQVRSRQALRLLSSPHRIGLPAPVVACTATPEHVRAAVARARKTGPGKRSHGGRRRSHVALSAAVGDDSTRSAREFGLSCALARRGYSMSQAWELVSEQEGKAAERGRRWWRRYVWLSAVTTAAAEGGVSEAAAWDLACQACPECKSLGQDWWHEAKWEPALVEAQIDRPRRYRIDDSEEREDLSPEVVAQIDSVRGGFEAALAQVTGLHPQRRHSVLAALCALAEAIVTRDGSISTRTLSLRALLDRKTVRRALATATEHGLLLETHAYAGGAEDCRAYGIGAAAAEYMTPPGEVSKASPTRCTTPAPLGHARSDRLRSEYAQDRTAWAVRCDVLAVLAPGERLANSQHPAAKLLRSLHHQRTWWRSLNEDEQEARREARKRKLRGMDPAARSDWFRWLERRELISNAGDRALSWTAGPDDAGTLLAAPMTIYRGMSDPAWRSGGTPVLAAA